GGSAANDIGKWNGSTWTALGSGINAAVLALAVSGTDVYAGGEFGGVAKWNGSTWTALGSGMGSGDSFLPPFVSALAFSGSDLYAAGWFTTAGGSTANDIADWKRRNE